MDASTTASTASPIASPAVISADALAVATAAADEYRPTSRLRINRVGLWLFIASESMIFAGLLAARFDILGTEVHEEVSQTVGLIITSILLLSSYTALRAEHAARHGDRTGTVRYLTATLALGTIFVAGVVIEWKEAFDAFPPDTSFGSVFFTMTGMHAFHVISGLAILALLLVNARRGAYDDPGPDGAGAAGQGDFAWPVEAGVKYWHFVDVVWVFFYPALYLL